ncbi:MAG: anthranilate phosphoribosyltransferase, partial [Actinomycetota bacterium]
AGPVRVELGVPTVFNLLGPLAHPGRVRRQVIGVSSEARAAQMAEVLAALGTTSAWVVAGADGLDELSTTGDSVVYTVDQGGVDRLMVRPAELGIPHVDPVDLAGGGPEANAEIFTGLLAGDTGPHRDIVQLNAAAGLVVGGRAETLEAGLAEAGAAIDDGRAAGALDRLRAVTKRLASG